MKEIENKTYDELADPAAGSLCYGHIPSPCDSSASSWPPVVRIGALCRGDLTDEVSAWQRLDGCVFVALSGRRFGPIVAVETPRVAPPLGLR